MPVRNYTRSRWEPDPRPHKVSVWDAPDACDRCGGGIDNDHPTTCSACLYEIATGRSYEDDVDAGVFEQAARPSGARCAECGRSRSDTYAPYCSRDCLARADR